MGVRFLKIAALYFLIGVGIGIFMESAGDHALKGVHAHVNLVGWASMAIFGFMYHLFPKLGESILGKIHFWAYNISLPLFMLGLGFLLYGNATLLPLVIIGANVLALSVVIFVINVFVNLKAQDVSRLKDQNLSM
ncbi:cytochrome-c oxidase [Bacillus sp. HMF5848]|uniref:cytochrome-c oxidase n=1 Tax=Bacillus sp. HMF5848 TaxID=2495421 RepID=UPI000F7A0981|nr:cytochrome-c oxidase [Bacillus sp. HMF5848]RSK27816.1 cytochrome-c oxidase [Bacillus sp. HMF5848]